MYTYIQKDHYNMHAIFFSPDKADSCTINGIMFLKQSEIVTVNSYGQLKLFDLRQNSDSPVQIFSA